MKILVTLILLITGALMMQVALPGNNTATILADTSYVNPNVSSELALLMREMQQYSNTAKSDIKAGRNPAPYPKSFDAINSAKISDNMSKSDYYESFAGVYLMAVKSYAKSLPADRIDTYNNMVNTCLACHSQHCPGPVPVIKKLLIVP